METRSVHIILILLVLSLFSVFLAISSVQAVSDDSESNFAFGTYLSVSYAPFEIVHADAKLLIDEYSLICEDDSMSPLLLFEPQSEFCTIGSCDNLDVSFCGGELVHYFFDSHSRALELIWDVPANKVDKNLLDAKVVLDGHFNESYATELDDLRIVYRAKSKTALGSSEKDVHRVARVDSLALQGGTDTPDNYELQILGGETLFSNATDPQPELAVQQQTVFNCSQIADHVKIYREQPDGIGTKKEVVVRLIIWNSANGTFNNVTLTETVPDRWTVTNPGGFSVDGNVLTRTLDNFSADTLHGYSYAVQSPSNARDDSFTTSVHCGGYSVEETQTDIKVRRKKAYFDTDLDLYRYDNRLSRTIKNHSTYLATMLVKNIGNQGVFSYPTYFRMKYNDTLFNVSDVMCTAGQIVDFEGMKAVYCRWPIVAATGSAYITFKILAESNFVNERFDVNITYDPPIEMPADDSLVLLENGEITAEDYEKEVVVDFAEQAALEDETAISDKDLSLGLEEITSNAVTDEISTNFGVGATQEATLLQRIHIGLTAANVAVRAQLDAVDHTEYNSYGLVSKSLNYLKKVFLKILNFYLDSLITGFSILGKVTDFVEYPYAEAPGEEAYGESVEYEEPVTNKQIKQNTNDQDDSVSFEEIDSDKKTGGNALFGGSRKTKKPEALWISSTEHLFVRARDLQMPDDLDNFSLVVKDSNDQNLSYGLIQFVNEPDEDGAYDMELALGENFNGSIKLHKLKHDLAKEFSFKYDTFNDNRWKHRYSLNISDLNVTSVNVSFQSKGKRLFRCVEWDFATQTCINDKWKKVKEMDVGDSYNIALSGNSTAYGESDNLVDLVDDDDIWVSSNSTILNNNTDLLDINVTPASNKIRRLKLGKYNISKSIGALKIKDGIHNSRFSSTFAIDPTEIEIENVTLTIIPTSNSLYKCTQWNFTTSTCYGAWELFKTDLIPGQEYTFTITPEDPGFGEINISNAQHLDENQTIIADVYNLTLAQDDVWSGPINETEMIRVTFEANLTNGNKIDVFVRNNLSSNTWIEVYYPNSSSPVLSQSKVFNTTGELDFMILTNMTYATDTFDLKVVNDESAIKGFLEFDYIHDVGGECGDAVACECGDTVTDDYTMSGDLKCSSGTFALRFNGTGENLTFDCAGYTITPSSGASYAIYAYYAQNVTLKNCVINSTVLTGVEFRSEGGSIIDSNITNFKQYGVNVYLADDVTIKNSTFVDIQTSGSAARTGIYVGNPSARLNVSGCKFDFGKDLPTSKQWRAIYCLSNCDFADINFNTFTNLNNSNIDAALAFNSAGTNNVSFTNNNVTHATFGIHGEAGAGRIFDNITVISNSFVNISNSSIVLRTTNNVFARNNFVNETRNLTIYLPGNVLNNSATGNYWSFYDESDEGCDDTNSDSYCDDPLNMTYNQCTGTVTPCSSFDDTNCSSQSGCSYGGPSECYNHDNQNDCETAGCGWNGFNCDSCDFTYWDEGSCNASASCGWNGTASQCQSLILSCTGTLTECTDTYDASCSGKVGCSWDPFQMYDWRPRTSYIEMSQADPAFQEANSAPTQTQPILNSTLGTNGTAENLTVYPQNVADADGDSVTNITDWRLEGTSITVLNMPFDTNYTNHSVSNVIRDYSTFENNGTGGAQDPTKTPTWTSNGKVGGAYVFDGVDDYINLSNGLSVGNNFSISFWANLTLNGGSPSYNFYTPISSYNGNNVCFHIYLRKIGSPQSQFYLGNCTGGFYTMNSDPGFNYSSWEFFTYTVNASGGSATMMLYLNGVLVDTNTSSFFGGTSDNAVIGISAKNLSTYPLDGTLDEMKIYNRSLSPEQVYQMYLDGNSSHSVETIVSNETSLGDTWQACITPNDGLEDGATFCSADLNITGAQINLSSCKSTGWIAGATYTITNIVNSAGSCMNIPTENVTLDCQKYAISGDGTGTGIKITGSNVVIKNCVVESFVTAVSADPIGLHIGNSSLLKSKIGLEMNYTNYSYVRNVTFINDSQALEMMQSFYNDISNCTFTNNTRGVRILSGSDNTFYYNNFTQSTFNHSRVDSLGNHFNISGPTGPWGNMWDNIKSLRIYDVDSDGFGDGGTDYPYNMSVSSKVFGYVTDYGPHTGNTTTNNDPVFNTSGPSDGIVMWLKMDEGSGGTAYDSADGHNGILNGGTSWTAGKVNGALDFNGVLGDYVRVPYTEEFNDTDDFAIELLIKTPADGDNDAESMVTLRSDAASGGIFLGYCDVDSSCPGAAPGTITFADATGVSFINSSTDYDDNAWHHIVAQESGGATYLYIDGVQQGSNGTDIVLNAYGEDMYLGYRPKYSDTEWPGLMDEVIFWNRALTAAEIEGHYNNITAGNNYTGTNTYFGAVMTNYTWRESTNFTLNLSLYFTDPDNHTLTYSFNDTVLNISVVNHGNGMVTLVSDYAWYGTRQAIFRATDIYGDYATSNEITLTVTEVFGCGETVNESITMQENLNLGAYDACFNISMPNIIFDCNNNTITGTGTQTGLKVNANNVTIRNCEMNNLAEGIWVDPIGAVIENSTFKHSRTGLVFYNTNYSRVRFNTFRNSSLAFNLTNSFMNNITNNTLANNTNGFQIFSGTGNLFYHNNFTSTTYYHVGANVSGNHFNSTIAGINQGNDWDDAHGLGIFDADANGFGDSGANYPYSNANGGQVSINVEDYGPIVSGSDSTPPTIFMFNCSPVPAYVNQTVVCNATVSDSSGISNVTVNITSPDGTVYSQALANISDNFTFNFTNTVLNGSYNVSWWANDTLSQSTTNNISFNVSNYPDNYTEARLMDAWIAEGNYVNLSYDNDPAVAAYLDSAPANVETYLRLNTSTFGALENRYVGLAYADKEGQSFALITPLPGTKLQEIRKIGGAQYDSISGGGNNYYAETNIDFSFWEALYPGIVYAVISDDDTPSSNDTFIQVSAEYAHGWLVGGDGGAPCAVIDARTWDTSGCSPEAGSDPIFDSYDIVTAQSAVNMTINVTNAYYRNWTTAGNYVHEITKDDDYIVVEIRYNSTDEYVNSTVTSLYENVTFPTLPASLYAIYVNGIKTGEISSADTVVPNVTDVKATPALINQSDIVNVSANVTDTVGVSQVLIEVMYPSGVPINYSATQNGHEYTLLFSNTLQVGNYTVKVIAIDTDGNENNTETAVFEAIVREGYGNTTVGIRSPFNNTAYIPGDSFTVSANITAIGLQVQNCFADINFVNTTVLNATTATNFLGNLAAGESIVTSFDVVAAELGTTDIVVAAYCGYGGSSSENITNISTVSSLIINSTVVSSTITNSSVINSTKINVTMINSRNINSNISYSYEQNTNVSSSIVDNSTLNFTNVTESSIINFSDVIRSTIINASIINSTKFNVSMTNSTDINSKVQDTREKDVVVIGSNVTNSTLMHSFINNSNITNSTIDYSNVSASNITHSYINGSDIFNSTLVGSTIINSTIGNDTIINQTIINDVEVPYYVDFFCYPEEGNLSDMVTCNVTVTDNNGVSFVYLNLTAPGGSASQPAVTNQSGEYSFTYTLTEVGTYDLLYWANDTSDNANVYAETYISTGNSVNGSTIINSTLTNSTLVNSTVIDSTKLNTIMIRSTNINATVQNSREIDANVTDSIVNNSNLTESWINDSSIIIYSNITDSIVINSSKIGAILVNVYQIGGAGIDTYELNSSVENSTIKNGTIMHSYINNSNITNSTIDYSNVSASNITDSNINGSNIYNSTLIGSIIINSTISNTTIINETWINNTEVPHFADFFCYPSEGNLGDLIFCNVTISDGNGISFAYVNLTSSVGTFTQPGLGNVSNQFSFNFTLLDAGTYSMVFLASDTAGNTNVLTESYSPSGNNVSGSTIINSTVINSTLLNSTVIDSYKLDVIMIRSTNINATVEHSYEEDANVTETIMNWTNVTRSWINDSSLIDKCNISDSIVINSSKLNTVLINVYQVGSVALDTYELNSSLENSTIKNGTIIHSYINNSNITNSTIDYSNVSASNITDSLINGSDIYNSTVIGSTIINSTTGNTTIINETWINDLEVPNIVNFYCYPEGANVTQNITCNVTVTDNDGVSNVSVNVSEPTGGLIIPQISNSTEHHYSFNMTLNDLGVYNMQYWANDTSGNTNVKVFTYVVTGNNVTNSTIINSTVTNSTIVNSTVVDSNKVNVVMIRSTNINATVSDSYETDTNVTSSIVSDSNLTDTWVNQSSLVGNSNLTLVTAINSSIYNSNKINVTSLNSTNINSFVQDSRERDVTIVISTVLNGTILHSYINNSNISNSTIDYSNVSASTINDSIINGSNIYNVTIIGSTIINSTIANITITNETWVNDEEVPQFGSFFCYPENANISNTVTCNVTITDNNGTSFVYANLTTPIDGFLQPTIDNSTNGQYSFSFTISDPGTFFITFWANDTTGNANLFEETYTGTGNNLTGSTIINSTVVNSTMVNSTAIDSQKTNVVMIRSTNINATVNNSYEEDSNVTETIMWDSNATQSWINDSSIIGNSNISDSIVINSSKFGSVLENVYQIGSTAIDTHEVNSSLENSTIKNGTIMHSYINNSNITNSSIDYSNVSTSNITDSLINGSDIYNSTIIGSEIINSTIGNDTVVNQTIINDVEVPHYANFYCYPQWGNMTDFVVCNVTVTDNDDVSLVTINLTYPAGGESYPEINNGTNHLYSFNFTLNETGDYSILYWANDTSGNANVQTQMYRGAGNDINGSTVINSTIINSTVTNSTVSDSVKINVTIVRSTDINATVRNSRETDSNVTSSVVDDSNLTGSWVNQSSLIGNSSIIISTVVNSSIYNTYKYNSTNINSSVQDSLEENSTVIGSDIVNSTIMNSTVIHSYINDSNISNSTIGYSNVTGSNVNDSYINGSNIYNSTVIGSVIINSTIGNETIINETWLNDEEVPHFTNFYCVPIGGNVSDEIECNITITDNNATSYVYVNLTSPQTGMVVVSVTVNISTMFSFKMNITEYGVYNFTYWANDTFDNSNVHVEYYLVSDNFAPTVVALNATPSVQNQSYTVNLSANVTDNLLVDSVQFIVIGPDGANATFTATNVSDIYNITFADTLQTGNYTFYVRANDTTGIINSTEFTNFWVNIGVGPGGVPYGNSSVNFTSPQNGTVHNDTGSFVVNASFTAVGGNLTDCNGTLYIFNSSVLTPANESFFIGNITVNTTLNVSVTMNALTSGSSDIKITAFCYGGGSDNETLYNQTVNVTSAGGAPENITIILNADYTVNITWSEVPGAASYVLYYDANVSYITGLSTAPSETPNATITDPTMTNFTDHDAETFAQRYYRVGASAGATTNLSAVTVGKLNVPVHSGFEMVSTPFNLTYKSLVAVNVSTDPLATNPADSLETVYRYNASRKMFEKSDYLAGFGWYGVANENLSSIELGIGYLVKSVTEANITFVGTVPVNKTNVSLTTGMNLVGYSSAVERILGAESVDMPVSVAPVGCVQTIYKFRWPDLFEKSDYFSGYGWRNATSYSSNFTAMEPGKGYWFSVTQDCSWV